MQCFVDRHEQKIACFKRNMSKIKNGFTICAGKDIDIDWIMKAESNYAKGVSYKEVVGLYDTTTFGKGKNGFLFTDDYLYWARPITKGVIKLDDLLEVTYYNENKSKDVDRGVVFHLKDGSTVEWDGFCIVKCGPFIKFMNEYIKI